MIKAANSHHTAIPISCMIPDLLRNARGLCLKIANNYQDAIYKCSFGFRLCSPETVEGELGGSVLKLREMSGAEKTALNSAVPYLCEPAGNSGSIVL